ncbi:hypothetical protein [Robbsia sp. KACC 23696]
MSPFQRGVQARGERPTATIAPVRYFKMLRQIECTMHDIDKVS